MHSLIFENKKKIDLDGVRIVNMFTKSIDYSVYPNDSTLIIATIEITDIMQCRPDIISQYFYKNPSFWDLILKYNGVSNPFSLEEGDLLFIPEITNFTKVVADVETVTDANASKFYVSTLNNSTLRKDSNDPQKNLAGVVAGNNTTLNR